MKHLILEGPDHIGKTTVAWHLYRKYDYRIHHMGVPTPDWDYEKDYLDRLPKLRVVTRVYDRFHLGALVYGRFLRLHSTNGWSWKTMTRIMQVISSANIPVVIMYTSNSNWLENLLRIKGKTEKFNVKQILGANEIYQMLAHARIGGRDFCQFAWDVKDGKYPEKETIEAWIR